MNGRSPAKILVVDDESLNRTLLKTYLESEGHIVYTAEDGAVALNIVQTQPVDVVLLDLVMPQPDGFQVLETLKADPNTENIPVVVVSASDDLDSAVRCIKMGAIDYLAKPYDPVFLKARIDMSLIAKNFEEMQRSYMHTLEARNEELDAFAHTVAHDLKSPIKNIIGFAEFLRTKRGDLLETELEESLSTIYRSAVSATKLIDDLLLLSQIRHDDTKLEALDMSQIVADAIASLATLRGETQARISFPNQWPVAYGQSSWVQEIWTNYLSNALKYGGTPPTISLDAIDDSNGQIKMWVQDHGPGIPADAQEKLFRPFTKLTDSSKHGHGLGLSIVRRLVEKMGGQVGVVSREGYGSQFWFTLPAKLH